MKWDEAEPTYSPGGGEAGRVAGPSAVNATLAAAKELRNIGLLENEIRLDDLAIDHENGIVGDAELLRKLVANGQNRLPHKAVHSFIMAAVNDPDLESILLDRVQNPAFIMLGILLFRCLNPACSPLLL